MPDIAIYYNEHNNDFDICTGGDEFKYNSIMPITFEEMCDIFDAVGSIVCLKRKSNT